MKLNPTITRTIRLAAAVLALILAVPGTTSLAEEQAFKLPNWQTKDGLAQSFKVTQLGRMNVDDVLTAFGAHMDKNTGAVSFGSSPSVPKLYNLLDFLPIKKEVYDLFYGAGECGVRGYQVVSVTPGGPLDAINVLYPCSNQCQAIHEVHEMAIGPNGKSGQRLTGTSEPTMLPESFCQGLFGGIVHVEQVGRTR